MNELRSVKGSCICQSVKITVPALNSNVGACHCNTCRKWSGGPLLAVDCGTEVKFEGENNVSVFDSSDWAERGFCSICGTHLFYRLKQHQQYIMPVGLFGDSDDFNLDHQIFIDQKPGYYEFANETSNMTGAEVFAKYGSSEGA